MNSKISASGSRRTPAMRLIFSLATVLALGIFPVIDRAASESVDADVAEVVTDISHGIKITVTQTDADPGSLTYTLHNSTKHKIYINPRALKEVCVQLDISTKDPRTGEKSDSHIGSARGAADVGPPMNGKSAIVLLPDGGEYAFNLNKSLLLSSVKADPNLLKDVNTTLTIQINIYFMVIGYDEQRANLELFRTYFPSEPIRLPGVKG